MSIPVCRLLVEKMVLIKSFSWVLFVNASYSALNLLSNLSNCEATISFRVATSKNHRLCNSSNFYLSRTDCLQFRHVSFWILCVLPMHLSFRFCQKQIIIHYHDIMKIFCCKMLQKYRVCRLLHNFVPDQDLLLYQSGNPQSYSFEYLFLVQCQFPLSHKFWEYMFCEYYCLECRNSLSIFLLKCDR